MVTYGYDGRGNRISRTSAEGVEEWGVNAADEQTLAEDLASRDTVTVYDQAGRVDTVSDPTGRVEDRDYDDAGRLVSRVDAGFASGIDGTTTYGYDDFGNVTSIAGPGLDLSFTWDRAGNRLTSTQDGVTTTYAHDGNGRLESVSNGWLGTATYDRNADGVVEEEVLGSGQWRQWTLDLDSGLPVAFDQRIDGVDTVTDLAWDAAGRLDSELTGGVLTEYGYDAAGQLTSVVCDGVGGGDDEVFTYDDLGRRVTQVDGADTTTFAYDSGTGELASMTHPVDGVTTFDYDAAGRRPRHRPIQL
jgi:YD repeat-containing protein